MKNKHIRIHTLILTVVLALSLTLSGCGSLSRILDEPDPPRENTTAVELTNLLRTEDYYNNIEVLHGTWDEPCYSPDAKGYFYEERGWIYLHIEGEPAERGYQHGWLLADYVQRNIDHNKNLLATQYSLDWEYLRVNAERLWGAQVADEYRAELEGIVQGATERGASFDYLDVVVLNGLEELRDCWFPTVQENYYQELAAGLWNPEEVVMKTSTDEAADSEDAEGQDESAEDSANGEDNSAESGEEASDNQARENEDNDEAAADEPEAAEDEASDPEESDASEEEIDANEAEEENPLALLPYVEIEGLTQVAPQSERGSFAPLDGVYVKRSSALLATGSATESGGIILAQNTIAAYIDSNFANVMIDVQPAAGVRFTMQAEPGFIHSFGEAYSSEQLVVANTRISGFEVYSEEGIPEFLRIRQAVQYATTLDEFTNTMLNGVNGGLASSWLVGDLETNQIMELELGLSFYNVQKLTDGSFISFDGVDDTRILTYETDGSGTSDIRLSDGARYVRLVDLSQIHQGKLTTERAQEIVSDHLDTYLNKVSASSRTVCAHYESDDAAYATDSGVEPYLPYGTVEATIMSTELAEEHSILARWGSACGRAFDSQGFIEKHPQYAALQDYLYDRPAQFWNELFPLGQ